MTKSPSFSVRAFSIAALFVGFYILAIGIATGLAFLPILLVKAKIAGFGIVQISLWSWLAAAAIVWSIRPRRDSFDPPYPRLTAGEAPRLFSAIEAVARQTEQDMPTEVYLLPEFNAWVAARGGIMGIGSRRVMGIGLPLLHGLSLSEFKSVIAHEFGHYHAGDTRLGPWVFATRSALARTIEGLSDSIVQAPFRWYAELFLQVSQSVSRNQEFTADRLAAETIGATPAISALRKSHSIGPAFNAYWQSDYGPALERFVQPPLLEGFQRFLSNVEIQRIIGATLAEEMAGKTAHPYDTHPAMSERIQALSGIAPGPDPSTEPNALSLLDGIHTLESRLLQSIVHDEALSHMKSMAWDDIGMECVLPVWQEIVRDESAALSGVTPAAMPALIADASAFARRLQGLGGQQVPDPAARTITIQVLSAAFGAGLARLGWQVDAAPERRQVALCRGDDTLEPFTVLEELASDTLTAETWRARYNSLGLADMDLGVIDGSKPGDRGEDKPMV